MPFDAEERDRLRWIAQDFADTGHPQVAITVEGTGTGVLIRGVRPSETGDQVETLNISWELVERSGAPEHFLRTQVWAVEHGLLPPGAPGRDRPQPPAAA